MPIGAMPGTTASAQTTTATATLTTTRRRAYIQRTLVTALAGGVSFALTNIVTQDPLSQLALSITVGGIVLLLQLLVDVEDRLAGVEAAVAEAGPQTRLVVRGAIAELSDVAGLLIQAEGSALGAADLRELVRVVAGVGAGVPALARALLVEEAARFRETAVGLRAGGIEREGEDREYLLALTRHAGRTIDAVSLQSVDGREFWSSGVGTRYLADQKAAVQQRGVRVRRIFVFYRLPGGREGLPTDVFAQHRRHGIEVRVLVPERIPDLLRNDLRDVIVFDGEVGLESTPASHPGDHGGEIRSTKIETRESDLARNARHFELLWAAAEPFNESESASSSH